MTGKRELLNRRRDWLIRSLTAPERFGTVTVLGAQAPQRIGGRTAPIDGENTVNWSTADFKRINDKALELEQDRRRALGGSLSMDEERNCFRIYFETGDDEILGQKDVLLRAVRAIGINVGCRVIVMGHTDENGDYNENMFLAARRATAVRARLSLFGVPFERMDLVSMGPNQPRLSSSPDSADARNRRVEILLKD